MKIGKPLATCKTCRFAVNDGPNLSCRRNAEVMIDPVYGERQREGATWCVHERMGGLLAAWLRGTCGREGRFWQPATKPQGEHDERSE